MGGATVGALNLRRRCGRTQDLPMVFSLRACYAFGMQITVEIPDELAAKVQARGLTPEGYVRSLIEEAERSAPVPLHLREPRMSIEEFLDAMAANSDKMPVLPEKAFTRGSFYQDHD